MLLVLIGFAALATACTAAPKKAAAPGPPATNSGKPHNGAQSSTTTLANVCQTNPYPATPSEVVVSSPAANAHVTDPFTVSGSINAFEATFKIAIKDGSGNDIIPVLTGHSQQGQTLSGFSQSVSFPSSTPAGPACLWVFQYSAKTGSPSTIEQVPITLP